MKLDFVFGNIPLTVGINNRGQRQNIALISGVAAIEYRRIVVDDAADEFEWEIVSARLRMPFRDDDEVAVEWMPSLSPLMDWVAESLEHHCGELIAASVRHDAVKRDRGRNQSMEAVRQTGTIA